MKVDKFLVLGALAVAAVGFPQATATLIPAGLPDLARAGRWERVLEVASRRAQQLPLNSSEAMIAAHAARVLDDEPSLIHFLELVVSGDNGELAELAEVQLAAVVKENDPSSAVDLAVPAFDRGRPWPLREFATQTVTWLVAKPLDADHRATVEGAAGRLPKGLRRRMELALALSDEKQQRPRLERLLASSTSDLVALEAAEKLASFDPMAPLEQWRVASALYRHALYDRAAPILEDLAQVRDASTPADQVLFTRGRCAFRGGRWDEAISWYEKALVKAKNADRRAEIEVHIGRTYELAGNLNEAVDAAVRAVRLDTTDARRIFLARLRLRRGEPDLAAQGIGRLRSRKTRAQGDVMLALDAMRSNDPEAASRRLVRTRRRPWSAPASVLAAQLAMSSGEWEAGVDLLEHGAPSFDRFWGLQARVLMETVPNEKIAAWRERCQRDADDAEGRARWRVLGVWANLEPDERRLEVIRVQVAAEADVEGDFDEGWFRPGLAADLWKMGLEAEAGRWDPSGFPNSDAVRSAWTAARFAEFSMPWRAVRVADGAWRQAGSEVPLRAFPLDFQKNSYPLPYQELVRTAAGNAGVEWNLLAAVAREESRWNPKALSAVGARGLVQLMPATALAAAARLSEAPPTAEDLFDPGTSLRIGAAEMGRLLEVFDGRRAPAIAAYNAGEQQSKLWLDQCGTRCSDAVFVANISFSATRAYTAEVLASAATYQRLYGSLEGPAPINE